MQFEKNNVFLTNWMKGISFKWNECNTTQMTAMATMFDKLSTALS